MTIARGGLNTWQESKNKYVENNLLNIKVPAYWKRSLKNSALVYFIKNKIDLLLWRLDINDSDDPQRSIAEDYYHATHKDPDGWNNLVAGMKKISKLCTTFKSIDGLIFMKKLILLEDKMDFPS